MSRTRDHIGLAQDDVARQFPPFLNAGLTPSDIFKTFLDNLKGGGLIMQSDYTLLDALTSLPSGCWTGYDAAGSSSGAARPTIAVVAANQRTGAGNNIQISWDPTTVGAAQNNQKFRCDLRLISGNENVDMLGHSNFVRLKLRNSSSTAAGEMKLGFLDLNGSLIGDEIDFPAIPTANRWTVAEFDIRGHRSRFQGNQPIFIQIRHTLAGSADTTQMYELDCYEWSNGKGPVFGPVIRKVVDAAVARGTVTEFTAGQEARITAATAGSQKIVGILIEGDDDRWGAGIFGDPTADAGYGYFQILGRVTVRVAAGITAAVKDPVDLVSVSTFGDTPGTGTSVGRWLEQTEGDDDREIFLNPFDSTGHADGEFAFLAGDQTFTGQNTFDQPIRYDDATGITAFATGGQASATALTAEINNVTTVATAGDSVKLPAAVAGMRIVVKNNGAATLAVFPATSDSINALAVNLSVDIAPNSSLEFFAKDAIVWETIPEGLYLPAATTQTGGLEIFATASAGNTTTRITNASQAAARLYTIPDAGADAAFMMTEGAQSVDGVKSFEDPIVYLHVTGITAFATGGQASATQLTGEYNNVTVCATANDSVKLLAAIVGQTMTVKNNGATNLAVFPATGDAIDAIAANTAIALVPNEQRTFRAIDSTTWESEEVIPRSNLQLETKAFPILFTDVKQNAATMTDLGDGVAATAANGFEMVGGTHGTSAPYIRSEAAAAAASETATCRVLVKIPESAEAATNMTLRIRAGVNTLAGTTATLDAEAYLYSKTGDEGAISGGALIGAAAVDINSTTHANKDFTITGATLSPGDLIDVLLTTAVNNGGGGSTVFCEISVLELLASVRG